MRTTKKPNMKKIASLFILAAISAALISVNAQAQQTVQSTSQRISTVEEHLASVDITLDSLVTAIATISADNSDVRKSVEQVRKEVRTAEEKIQGPLSRIKQTNKIVLQWFFLLLFAVFLPLVLIWLFYKQNKEKQRRYDIIVDMVRSGVEIKPEMMPFLTGTDSMQPIISGKNRLSGMNKSDIDYCARRLIWSVASLLIGACFWTVYDWSGIFFTACCITIFFIAQAAIRYYSVRYFDKHSKDADSTNVK